MILRADGAPLILSGHEPGCKGLLPARFGEACDCGSRDATDALADIEARGFTVRWVDYCEDSRTPGLLGQIRGVTDWERREVKIGLKANPDTLALADILQHEARHVREPSWDCGNRDVFGRGGGQPDHDDWPVHQPAAPDAPIPGRHWYAGCDPDRPRVNPATGQCEGCGEPGCEVCGREDCPDHATVARNG